MFLFGAVFAIVSLAYFLLGGVTEILVCDTFRNPNRTQVMEIFDNVIKLDQLNANTNISTILKRCHNNNSIYTVLDLEKKFDLSKIENFWSDYNIDETLNKMMEQIESMGFNNIQLLNENSKKQLDNLIESGVSDIKFDKFINEVSLSIRINYLK